MAARRTASQIATLAALAVAAVGGTVAHTASARVSGPVSNVFVIVMGSSHLTLMVPASIVPASLAAYSGVAQTGGGG
ncbi:MAG: hypothetical protein ACK5F5_12385 [Gammaproteobacteria bacterium]|jgi:hypothetical protein